MSAWGAWDRNSGLCILKPFAKLNENGEYRFGPAKIEEVIPLVVKYVQGGCLIISDGLLAYRNTLTEIGFTHEVVNHSAGEYVRRENRAIHTQTIEGKWGDLKNTLRAMRGTKRQYQPLILFERMWRHNTKQLGLSVFDEILCVIGRAEEVEEEEDVVDEDAVEDEDVLDDE